MKSRAAFILLLKLTATAAALGYVFHTWVDGAALATAIRQVSPGWISAAIGLALINRWVLADQFRRMAEEFALPYRTLTVMKAHLISSFFAAIAPGEVASSGASWHYLAREHGAYGKVAGILVFLKLVGYACLAFFALFALLLEPRLAPLGVHRLALLPALACIVGLVALLHPKTGPFVTRRARTVAGWIPWRRPRELLVHGIEAFLSVHGMPWKAYAWAISHAVLSNVVGALTLGCLFEAAGVHIPWSAWFWLRAVLTIVQTVPISVAGTGVREITFVYLLQSLYGVPPAMAVTGSLLSLGLNLFFGIGIGSLLFVMDPSRRGERTPSQATKVAAQSPNDRA